MNLPANLRIPSWSLHTVNSCQSCLHNPSTFLTTQGEWKCEMLYPISSHQRHERLRVDSDLQYEFPSQFLNVAQTPTFSHVGEVSYTVGLPLSRDVVFFSFWSSGYQLGCTVTAALAQRPVEHVKNVLLNITTEWTPHSVESSWATTGRPTTLTAQFECRKMGAGRRKAWMTLMIRRAEERGIQSLGTW